MTTSTPRFAVLHALKVKGLANDEILGAMTGLSANELTESIDGLVAEEFAIRRDAGRISGTMITPAGRIEHDRLLAENPLDASAQEAVAAFDAGFGSINTEFKKVCSDWQMRPDGEANDHTDADYDAGVITALGGVHEQIVGLLDEVGAAVPRLGRYRTRLDGALERVRGGDTAAFARPMYDSYHDIWMELHQDLLLTVGRERGAGDE